MILWSTARSRAVKNNCVTYGCVKTPADVFPLPPFFAAILWGAESLPKKNFPLLVTAALIKAALSLGHFATGLLFYPFSIRQTRHLDWTNYQKQNGSSAHSSTVKKRWWIVMVPTTLAPHSSTASIASLVVQCSRTIFNCICVLVFLTHALEELKNEPQEISNAAISKLGGTWTQRSIW